jgi:stage II sporulation protein D
MRLTISLLLSFFALSVLGQKLSISVFNNLNLQTILVTPVSGNYALITGNEEFILRPNQIIYISKSGDSVKVRDMSSNLGTWKRVSLVGKSDNDAVRINPISPSNPARIYDDNMGFYVDFGRLMVINLIDQEKYIAGVIEAESGPNAPIEFYKAQALLARTYALGHIDKHMGEGFNLCDEVHCQAYKGKSTKNPDILKAAKETTGLVIVDETEQLIVGAFHANCGGETANAGDVWLTSKNYLVSVTDNYCKSSPSAQWEVRIPLEEWKAFLKSKGVDVENISDNNYVQASKSRVYVYKVGQKQIPLTEIRNHFKLRSAYFSVELVSGAIRIRGRGYGHGVGLCQDGAIQMARKGLSFEKILNHYFSNVRVVAYSSISPDQHSDDLIDAD